MLNEHTRDSAMIVELRKFYMMWGGHDIDTDHRLLMTTLDTPEAKKAHRKPKQNPKVRRFALKSLKDDDINRKFKQQIILQTGVPEAAFTKSVKLVKYLAAASGEAQL